MRAPHLVTQWLFTRALGLIHLAYAFMITYQMRALISSEGVSPAAARIPPLRGALPSLERLLTTPTFGLWSTHDLALYAHGGVAVLLSLLLLGGVAPRLTTLMLWLVTLSTQTLLGPFAGAPADALLLEITLFSAFFLAGDWSAPDLVRRAPSALGVWLARLLLFKYLLLSGFAAVADKGWLELTALDRLLARHPAATELILALHHLPEPAKRAGAQLLLIALVVGPFLILNYLRGWRLVAFTGGCALALLVGQTRFSVHHLMTLWLLVGFLDGRLRRRRRRRRGADEKGWEGHPSPDRLGALLIILPLVAFTLALGERLLPALLLLLSIPLASDHHLRPILPRGLRERFEPYPAAPTSSAQLLGLGGLALFITLGLSSVIHHYAPAINALGGAEAKAEVGRLETRFQRYLSPLGLGPRHDLLGALEAPGEVLMIEVEEAGDWRTFPVKGQPDLGSDALAPWPLFYQPRLARRLARAGRGVALCEGLLEALARRDGALKAVLRGGLPPARMRLRVQRFRARLARGREAEKRRWQLRRLGARCALDP